MLLPDYDTIILGAGFGGIGLAILMQEAGRTDFCILEQSDRVGGTWRDNSYPGACCDVPSHLYCYGFDAKRDWTRVFSPQAEILGYIEGLVAKHDLRSYIKFGAEVASAAWIEKRGWWEITIANAQTLTARSFVAAWGQLNRPYIPAIPGAESFAGEHFHSARWRHDLDLTGKRVASIGNAASAVQFVPHVAASADHLDVFQRSANYVVPRLDRAYTAEEIAAFSDTPDAYAASRATMYAEREDRFARMRVGSDLADELAGIARDQLHAQIIDPVLRAKLTPDYAIGCKRILISDDYYPALTRPNVSLVTEPIIRIVPEGIVTGDGALHPADIVIYATGFETRSFQGSVEITGRDGRSLRTTWAGTPRAHCGITVSGFPNFFMLYGPNTNLGHNSILEMLEAQSRYILQALALIETVDAIDVRPEVLERSDAAIQAHMRGAAWAAGCTSWYVGADGRVINNWSGTVEDYKRRVATLDPTDFVPVPIPETVSIYADSP